MSKKPKVLLAVGGTGGHLFPAQALAKELDGIEILFAGAGLSKNRYFQKENFPYQEIASGTFLTANILRNLKGFFAFFKGIWQSLALLRTFSPNLVVGFGSYHMAPLLLAARLKKVPIVLFAADAIPGKVIRYFSKKARLSAVQFEEAASYLKGACRAVHMPFWSAGDTALSKSEAKRHYQLEPARLTLLVFGGSQGALALNELAARLALSMPFQVIHLVGHEKDHEEIEALYKERQIPACVKPFEDKMHYAWRAADLAICRAGASTIAELLFYEVPAILIPYPYAADNHQERNGQIFERLGGAKVVRQQGLTPKALAQLIETLPLAKMKENLALFKQNEKKDHLATLIRNLL
jgi:UDP-N-acetylglucosamine--N-acetylmuramyl-(pentapeptide) pyrophosphoryl-undecaprenol N-acetylglucosamine transferase